jgi:hypothetical protein
VQRVQLRPQQDLQPPHGTAPGAEPARMYAATANAGRGDIESISKDSKAIWLDSGSTNHIVCSCDMMVNCTASPVSNVLAVGGESHEVMCCGQVYLQCTTGTEVGLSDVRCVPTLKVNFMSETQLMCRGASNYKFDGNVSLTDKEGDVFMRGTVEDGRIRLQCKVATP